MLPVLAEVCPHEDDEQIGTQIRDEAEALANKYWDNGTVKEWKDWPLLITEYIDHPAIDEGEEAMPYDIVDTDTTKTTTTTASTTKMTATATTATTTTTTTTQAVSQLATNWTTSSIRQLRQCMPETNWKVSTRLMKKNCLVRPPTQHTMEPASLKARRPNFPKSLGHLLLPVANL